MVGSCGGDSLSRNADRLVLELGTDGCLHVTYERYIIYYYI